MTSLKSDELDVAAWFKDELQCHICKNLLSNPRSLNCFHHFCLECLEKHAYNLGKLPDGSSSRLNIFCPSCESGTVVEGSGSSLSRLKMDKSLTRLLGSLHGLGLISKDGGSEGSVGSRDASGQSFELPSGVTSVDSFESLECPSFVTSVGSESSMSLSSMASGDLMATSPRGNIKEHIASGHGDTTSRRAFDESIGSLRSSGFQCKSQIAPNQVVLPSDSYDSANMSLAISSEGNTATTKSSSADDQISLGMSSGNPRSENNPENEPANIMMERRCPRHPRYQVTTYCIACKVAICHMCEEEEHPGHEVNDLQAEADLMRCELVTMIKDATAAIQIVDKAQNTLHSESESLLASQLDLVENQIKVNAQVMIAQIEKDKERLLTEVKRIRQASSIEQLNTLEQDISTGKHVATIVKRRGDAVDVMNTSRAICEKMRKATTICASGGAIDRIGELSVQFLGNGARNLAVGNLHENTEWTLSQQLSIPFDKRGCMQGMVSLRNGRLAVGYETGGIDIFSTLRNQDRPLSRILENVKLVDLASTSEDTMVVYPMYGDITEVTSDGEKRPTKFAASASTERVSMSSSIDGRIFLGYAEHGEIHQFQQSGGNPLKSIPIGKCRPQQIDVTASGKVIVKDMSGVKVLDLTSNDVTDIFKANRGQFAYSTCDINDHVYVAKVSALDSKASIDKYTLDGSLVESVSRGLEMSRNLSGGHWLRLVSLSPSQLAACDGSLISIYQRQPSAIELANDLGL